MATSKMTVTVPVEVLDQVDDDAEAAGMNRSEYVSRVLREEHYRRLLARTTRPAPVPPPGDDDGFLPAVLAWQNGEAAA